MLQKKFRVPKETISQLYRHGKRIYSNTFSYLYIPNTLGISRLAIVVGKKVSKSAAKRNRIKRLIREAFQQMLHSSKNTVDWLIFPKKDCSRKNMQAVLEELKKVVQQ